MTVLTLAGKPINWAKPPKATARVMWSQRTTGGKPVTGSLRTISWLDHVNTLAIAKFKRGVSVIQPCYNTGVALSKGTHDFDACLDVQIVGVPWPTQQKFFRANGAGAYWRTPAEGFSNHIHLFVLPPREGVDVSDDYKTHGFKVGYLVDGGWSTQGRVIASSQIADYYGHRNALVGHAHDPSWFPPNIPATIFDLPAFIAKRAPGRHKPTAPTKPKPAPVPAGTERIDGIDMSHFQNGTVDLAKAKRAGVKWLVHKASEGVTFKDPNYAKRRAEAKAAGLPFGAYHFAQPGKAAGDAAHEAAFFLSVAKPKPGDLRPTLDIEVTNGLTMTQIAAWVTAYSNAIFKALGVRPIIYTQSSWDLGAANEKNHTMWRARYSNSNTKPVRAFDLWQFSDGTFGKPNAVVGVGHCDLTTMRAGMTVDHLLIADAKPKPPAKATMTLRWLHSSMQFSDSAEHHEEDVKAILSRGADVITGTEAGPGAGTLSALLKKYAKVYGYECNVGSRYDTWVMVKKSLVKSGFKTGAVFALWRKSKTKFTPLPGPSTNWGDKAVVWLRFNTGKTFGAFSFGSVHYLTKGGAGADYKPVADKTYAEAINTYATEQAKAGARSFVGGDFNLLDRNVDVFYGKAPFLTAADQLKDWQDTGHGGIDAAARNTDDKGVTFTSWHAYPDSQVPLNTDHYLTEAHVKITAL